MPAIRQAVVYSIGEAARLAGVSQAAVRRWEGEGLLRPRRTPGGHRLYEDADIARLRHITYLRRFAGINSAAIRLQLGRAPDGPTNADPADLDASLGPRLRARQRALGFSLADVSATSGLSISFLSSVERGRSGVSLDNLLRLAQAYATTIPGLQAGDLRQRATTPGRLRHLANRGRVLIEDLIASPRALEAQRIEIAPGGESENAFIHRGEEFIYVLEGEVTLWLDEHELHVLHPGDALTFASTRAHSWRNEGPDRATVLWVNASVVFHSADGD